MKRVVWIISEGSPGHISQFTLRRIQDATTEIYQKLSTSPRF